MSLLDRPRRFVLEVTPVTGSGGATTTLRVASRGLATRPTDTPAATHIPPGLIAAGDFKRELFKGRAVMGAVRPSWGDVVIANDDGSRDAWLGYGWAGAAAVLRMGDDDDAYPAGYVELWRAQVLRIEARVGNVKEPGHELRLRLRDGLEKLDRPLIADSFAGTGGLEGTTGVAGKLKQWVSSDPGFIPVALVDASLQLYHVQSTGTGGLGASFKALVGGVEVTRGADYASAADCLATAPAAGQCRFWFGTGGAGPVYLRLDAAPAFDLRVQAFGYTTAGQAWKFTDVAALAGLAGGSGTLLVGARLVDDGGTTYADVLADSAAAQFGFFGVDRLGVFRCGTLDVPAGSPLYTFTHHNAGRWAMLWADGTDAPVWQVNVSAGRTWPSNLQASATAANKDYLSREPVWCAFSGEDAAVQADNPGAASHSIRLEGRYVQDTSHQAAFLSAFFARFGARRQVWQCAVPITAAALALELGDCVSIQMPRYGLASGRLMRIIVQAINPGANEITFAMWG